jgi:hypothetical protein
MSNKQMQIEIKDGVFKITVDTELACFAVSHGIETQTGTFDVLNTDKFSQDILKALREESEDGTNLIHEAFDKAALKAIEDGSENIRFPQED